MFFHAAVASFLGAVLGAMYGFLFIRRVKNSTVEKKPTSFVCSFFVSYCLVAVTISTLMVLFKNALVWVLVFFLIAFWLIVWKNAGRLSS